MTTKTKLIIVYMLTFILLFSNAPIFNGTTIIEMILMTFGITCFGMMIVVSVVNNWVY